MIVLDSRLDAEPSVVVERVITVELRASELLDSTLPVADNDKAPNDCSCALSVDSAVDSVTEPDACLKLAEGAGVCECNGMQNISDGGSRIRR